MNGELETLGHGFFSLYGQADASNVGRLLTDGREQFIGLDEITVDLELADCCNTAGVALLMEWSTWCQSCGIKLTYRNPQDKLLDMIEMSGVEQILRFSDCENRNLLRATGN